MFVLNIKDGIIVVIGVKIHTFTDFIFLCICGHFVMQFDDWYIMTTTMCRASSLDHHPFKALPIECRVVDDGVRRITIHKSKLDLFTQLSWVEFWCLIFATTILI